jgi:hypothetical protein
VVGLIHRMAIIARGIDGTSVYLIRVSYLPKYGWDNDGVGCEIEPGFAVSDPSLLPALCNGQRLYRYTIVIIKDFILFTKIVLNNICYCRIGPTLRT